MNFISGCIGVHEVVSGEHVLNLKSIMTEVLSLDNIKLLFTQE